MVRLVIVMLTNQIAPLPWVSQSFRHFLYSLLVFCPILFTRYCWILLDNWLYNIVVEIKPDIKSWPHIGTTYAYYYIPGTTCRYSLHVIAYLKIFLDWLVNWLTMATNCKLFMLTGPVQIHFEFVVGRVSPRKTCGLYKILFH